MVPWYREDLVWGTWFFIWSGFLCYGCSFLEKNLEQGIDHPIPNFHPHTDMMITPSSEILHLKRVEPPSLNRPALKLLRSVFEEVSLSQFLPTRASRRLAASCENAVDISCVQFSPFSSSQCPIDRRAVTTKLSLALDARRTWLG